MATYYVDFVNGLDANNGLGPDASHGTNKPWKTITKLLGAAGMASGDTAYLSPAGPFREVVSVAMTSATAETLVIGDPQNAQGFKTSGGVLVAPGPVIHTGYTTNDKTAGSATNLLALAGRDFLTFRNIMFFGTGAAAKVVENSTGTSTNITFTDCAFQVNRASGFPASIHFTQAGIGPYTILVDRCVFCVGAGTSGFQLTSPLNAANVDYDVDVIVRNSIFVNSHSGTSIFMAAAGGSGTGKPGGMEVLNCSLLCGSQGVAVNAANAGSTTIPMVVNNCLIWGCNVGISAATSGQITENYCVINANTPRTNVSAGANSISDGSYAPLFHFNQERLWGASLRPFGEPMSGSPLLGYGNDGSQTAYDARNGARPAGGNGDPDPAVGAYERGNTWAKETSTVRTGSNALSITGPGYHDFDVPVDATSTTITVYLRHDTTYAGTMPKLQVLANAEIGVTAAEDTSGTTDDTWEQQSLTFTPTAKGIVTIRLLSLDTNGGGKAFADDLAVA